MNTAQKLDRIRKLMNQRGIDAYIVLSDDYHGSEYVGEYFKEREYLSGFTGSAGSLVILQDEAGLWTDGRYFLQAEEQLQGTGITLYREGITGVPTIYTFLQDKLKKGRTVAYDGRAVNGLFGLILKKQLKDMNYLEDMDLAGEIWDDRPPVSEEKIWFLEEEYTGESTKEKLKRIRAKYTADRHLISTLDDIAWILNIRGNDIEYTPVALAYLIIEKDYAILYISKKAVSSEIEKKLSEEDIRIREYDHIFEDLENMSGTVFMDKKACSMALIKACEKSMTIIPGVNPSSYMKACKNEVEIENMRKAHLKDGIAVTRFIYDLKHRKEDISEMEAGELLEGFRKQGEQYLGQSFAPIIASGSHGAIVHYEATEKKDKTIEKDGFVLMDTGGHYMQGTTDITRTITLGELTAKQKEYYTAVLAGNLNLAAAHFTKGSTGGNLDVLARTPLWDLGEDYRHGTGHGVGYLLSVHEGPNNIRLRNANIPFAGGMVTSDEPGVYFEGEYGIRLENLMLCHDLKNGFMEFETLTLVPFERKAILPEKLTEKQLETLNNYHRKVYESLSPYLDEDERKWLGEQTASL